MPLRVVAASARDGALTSGRVAVARAHVATRSDRTQRLALAGGALLALVASSLALLWTTIRLERRSAHTG